MKMPSPNTLFLVIATVVVAGGIYWYFFSSAPNLPLSSSATPNVVQARFETLTGQLQPITFDLTVLSDPRLSALVDIATAVTPEASGRDDPFAPVSGISAK